MTIQPQLIESTNNPKVVGSNPPPATNEIKLKPPKIEQSFWEVLHFANHLLIRIWLATDSDVDRRN